jgi:hypothetical protein
MGMIYKSFGAFLIQAAKAGIDKAAAVALYVENREDTARLVRARIDKAFKEADITADRRDALLSLLAECIDAHKRSGKVVDTRDPSDWATIGEGCKMHKIHRNND